jgi:mRNA-degrading endonuclease RelE of RelBE toxin-antitoxin system
MRQVAFTPDAVRQFKRSPRAARLLIKEAIRKHLIEADPAETTRNKFRLRRASSHADFELRTGDWRVFYRLVASGVIVTLVGEKRGASLFVEGEELKL